MNNATPAALPRFSEPARLHRLALAAVLALPFCLFYARGIADALLSLAALLFLARSAATRQWRWARQPWMVVGLLFWLLMVASSWRAGPPHSALEALALLRLLLFVAALQCWVLEPPQAQRWLGYVYTVLGLWLAVECWQQYLFGHNLLGYPRWGDGSLTGPFIKPRAGDTFLMLIFPGLMPLVLNRLGRGSWRRRLGGFALLAALVLTMILIGQRMPNLLLLFGLVVAALLVRQFRAPVLVVLVLGALVLVALPVISPPTYAKLVVHFTQQMGHFLASPYGQLYTRAGVMVAAHPWAGLGFDGFRDYCTNPAYFHGLPALGIADASNGGAGACNLHPHNYYAQAATSAGLPGLGLFVALVALWLGAMWRGRTGAPQQAMLLVAFCVIFWPIASTSSLFTLPTAGWAFLATGWALAASRTR